MLSENIYFSMFFNDCKSFELLELQVCRGNYKNKYMQHGLNMGLRIV